MPSPPPQHGRCVPACPRCGGGKVDDGRKWGKLGEGEEVDASCGLRNVTRLHYAITDGKLPCLLSSVSHFLHVKFHVFDSNFQRYYRVMSS